MFKLKIFKVDTINYTDNQGNKRVFYRYWFNLDTGLCWLSSDKPFQVGQEVQLSIVPMNTNDTKTNMRISLRID